MAETSEEKTSKAEVTVQQAARMLGCSRIWVHKLCDKGQLRYRTRGNNTRVIDAESVQEALANGTTGDDPADTIQLSELQNELTQMALKHVKDTFEPVTAAWEKAGNMYQRVIDSLISRNEKLESTHLDMIKQREAFMSEQHTRDLARADAEFKQAQLRDLLSPLRGALPDLLAQVGESLGGKKRTAMAALVAKLAASGKLQALFASGFLSEDEASALKEALADFLPKDEVETSGETVADTSDQTQSQSSPDGATE